MVDDHDDDPPAIGPERTDDVSVKIFVKTLSGGSIALSVDDGESVHSVRSQIQARDGIPPEHQCLTFAGKLLDAHARQVRTKQRHPVATRAKSPTPQGCRKNLATYQHGKGPQQLGLDLPSMLRWRGK